MAKKKRKTKKRNPCKKKNPARRKNDAVHIRRELKELYRTFHGHDYRGVNAIDLNIESGLVLLGKCDGILYQSDKWGGKNKAYIHKFKKSYPLMFCDIDGDALIIKGNFRIKEEGITG